MANLPYLVMVCSVFLENWKGSCQKSILKEGVAKKTCCVPNYTQTGQNLSGNRAYGLMNPDLEFLVQNINKYGAAQEIVRTVSVKSHL